MATKTNSLEELKSDFLNCQICMEECVKPKQLECLHFFCEHCLSKWKRNKRIECPTCREVTVLPNGSTSSLKSMFFVSSMIDAIKSKMEQVTVSDYECEAASRARVDIEQGVAKIDQVRTQLNVAESKLMSEEDDIKASVAKAESELEKIYDASLKALKTKRDIISSQIQALTANDKRHLSEAKSAIASSKEILSKLAKFFRNLQEVNGKEFDLAYNHSDIVKKTNEISAVKVPEVQKQSTKIRFQPNMVCVARQEADLMTLGLVADQEMDLKVELLPSKMPANQQNFLVQVVREAYKQPNTTQDNKKIMHTRMRHISCKMGETFGKLWMCVMGGNYVLFSEYRPNSQAVIVNDCEKIVVFKLPAINSNVINLSSYEAEVVESNGNDFIDGRVCRIANRVVKTCKCREDLCTELAKRLQQSLSGEWHVLFVYTFTADEFFKNTTAYYMTLEIADEKLVIFKDNDDDCGDDDDYDDVLSSFFGWN